MNKSFKEILDMVFPNSFQFYQYQLDFLNDIENNSEPINLANIWLLERNRSKRYWHMLNLTWNLLNNKNVLDLHNGFFYRFEINEEGEMELRIDEYSHRPRGKIINFIIDEEGSIRKEKECSDNCEVKIRTFTDYLEEALSFINQLT